MASITTTVCDVCHTLGRDTEQWHIDGPDGPHDLDLCDEDSYPLRSLISNAGEPPEPTGGTQPPPRTRAAPARRGGPKLKVTSMDEIERAKARA